MAHGIFVFDKRHNTHSRAQDRNTLDSRESSNSVLTTITVKGEEVRERKSLLNKRVSGFCGQEKQNPVRAEFRLTRSEAELGFAMERTSGVKQRIPELL